MKPKSSMRPFVFFVIQKITPRLLRGNLILLVIVIILSVVFESTATFAHSGGTDSYGCHTCRTNCPSYGLDYDEYHCHQSKGLPQPEYPIRSHDGWTEPWPEYTYPNYSYPPTPSCPIFSSYNSLSGSCECYYGYVADSYGSCESGNSACYRQFGYNSSYRPYDGKCECNYGYVFNSSNQCVSRDDYCQDILGWNAEYKILDDICGCRNGYILNTSQTSCISGDNYCTENFGWNSYYDSLDKSCKCEIGYEFKGNQCAEIKISEPIIIPSYRPLPTIPVVPINNSPTQQNKSENSKTKKDNIKNDSKNIIKPVEHSDAASSSKELLASLGENNIQQEEKSSTKRIWNKIKSFWRKLRKK